MRPAASQLGGNHTFSTLRFSLGSILVERSGQDGIDEGALTVWMHRHLRVVTVGVADANTLGATETAVLHQLHPPLSLAKVPRSSLRKLLSELRKRYGDR